MVKNTLKAPFFLQKAEPARSVPKDEKVELTVDEQRLLAGGWWETDRGGSDYCEYDSAYEDPVYDDNGNIIDMNWEFDTEVWYDG